ncbi:peptidylprolyl isomerase [Eubacteriales bacterium OttesenSCG-928-M02]|nr:peptidylprolyl isomerase [Eubacteriales bacterium OttesenSCG-928-M02]
MKKMTALVLCILMLGSILVGCTQVNREKDMAQVIIKVGDKTYTKQQIYDFTDQLLSGQGVDVFDDKMDSDLRAQVDTFVVDSVIPYLSMLEVAGQIVDRDMPLTEEEIKASNDEVDEYVEMIKVYYLENYDAENPDAYEGDIDADVDAVFLEYEGFTVAQYRTERLRVKKATKLEEYLAKDVVATEEEIQKRYETDLASQKASIINGEAQYEEATADGSSQPGEYTLHKALNYRLVKHVLLSFTAEEKAEITEEQKKVTAVEEELETAKDAKTTAETAKTAAETAKQAAVEAKAAAEAEGNTEEATAQQAEIEKQEAEITAQAATITEKETQMAKLETQRRNAQTAFVAFKAKKAERLMNTAKDIVRRAKNGEDFQALVDEYGEDPGVKEGQSGYIYGYLINGNGTGYDADFAEAALSLEKQGDVSDPVVSNFGVHIISLFYGPEEADLPLELVKSMVKEKADADAQSAAIEKGLDAYEEELGTKTYPKKAKWEN